jgi:hypothetical protein
MKLVAFNLNHHDGGAHRVRREYHALLQERQLALGTEP